MFFNKGDKEKNLYGNFEVAATIYCSIIVSLLKKNNFSITLKYLFYAISCFPFYSQINLPIRGLRE